MQQTGSCALWLTGICYVVIFLSKQVSFLLKWGVSTENCAGLGGEDPISIELQGRLELKNKSGTV